MKERATDRRRWRVGELARATGLTVRTLHHYESIGLLVPSRTEGHQRLYDDHDARRLYRICALRDLGLSLAEIGRILADHRVAILDVLRAHRDRVNVEIQRLDNLRTLLDHACAQADADVDADDLLATIEAMSRVNRRGKDRLEQQTGPQDDEARWRELGDELRACMIAGESPAAPRPRAVARAALARIVEFAGGDPAALEALAHLRRFAPPQDLAGWDPALMRYLDQALQSLPETDETC